MLNNLKEMLYLGDNSPILDYRGNPIRKLIRAKDKVRLWNVSPGKTYWEVCDSLASHKYVPKALSYFPDSNDGKYLICESGNDSGKDWFISLPLSERFYQNMNGPLKSKIAKDIIKNLDIYNEILLERKTQDNLGIGILFKHMSWWRLDIINKVAETKGKEANPIWDMLKKEMGSQDTYHYEIIAIGKVIMQLLRFAVIKPINKLLGRDKALPKEIKKLLEISKD